MNRQRNLGLGLTLVVMVIGLVLSATTASAYSPATQVRTAATHAQATSGHPPANVRVITRQYLAPNSPIVPNASTSAPWSTTFDWGSWNGDVVLNLSGTPTFTNEPAFASVSEAGIGNGEFIGAAKITVNNVSVSGSNIAVWLTINWGSPLHIHVHYLAI
jgi:hypothetical protein